MGAGKTSVGRRVARELGVEFTDTDKLIVREHGPIPEFFEAYGEERFREIERDAVAEALTHGGVIALGGGAVLDSDTRAALGAHRVVLLTVAPHVIAARISGQSRPLIAGVDPVQRWERIYAERSPIYAGLADTTFDTTSGPLSAVVDGIVAWAQEDA